MRAEGKAGLIMRCGLLALALLVAAPGWADNRHFAAVAQGCPLQASQVDTVVVPVAGQAFHSCFMGSQIDIPARNRRSVTAWALGLLVTPQVEERAVTPFGSLYLWRHPDANSLLRGVFSGAYNHVLFAYSPANAGAWEMEFSFENFALPVDRAEFVDGQQLEQRELNWGYVRLGIGVGWRKQVAPGHQDNMLAVSLRLEPGYTFFGRGKDDAAAFVTPGSTYETRLHLRLRWDALTRNLLELADTGFALGADAVMAHRSSWDDWGIMAQQSGSGHQAYSYVTAYLRTASGLPGLGARHRLLTSLHVGVGHNLDRFSAPRVGGGPSSDEFGSISRAVIPGTAVNAYYPGHYMIVTVAYRYQLTFFTYLGLRTSAAYFDRRHLHANGSVGRSDDWLESIGVRLTSGFFFGTQLVLAYDYNFGVLRDGRHGGQAALFMLSGSF